MTTAVTKFPRVVRAILLLCARPTQAKPVDRPLSRRQIEHSTACRHVDQSSSRPECLISPCLYRKKRFLAFCFTGAA
jgi:hypothetical protein